MDLLIKGLPSCFDRDALEKLVSSYAKTFSLKIVAFQEEDQETWSTILTILIRSVLL